MTLRNLQVAVERWPIAGRFAIARGAKREAEVVVATVSEGRAQGRGEGVPYARYGESVAGAVAALQAVAGQVREGLDRHALLALMPPGAARNALDCALWDLEAKCGGRSAAELAGLGEPRPVQTAFTISLDAPEAMAAKAAAAAGHELLKLKLGGGGDPARLAAVREVRPDARLIVDVNEAWVPGEVERMLRLCAEMGVELVEQPVAAGHDDVLARIERAVPVCADEALPPGADPATLVDRYDAVNIKLDKAGGLTAALAQARSARSHGLAIMVGCMVATSLAMAPALLLAPLARYVDLDGPLLLERDRAPGLVYEGGFVRPAAPALWG